MSDNKNLSVEEILAEAKAQRAKTQNKLSPSSSPDLMESLADPPSDVDSLSVYIKFGQVDKSIEEITQEVKEDFAKAAQSAADKSKNNISNNPDKTLEKVENSKTDTTYSTDKTVDNVQNIQSDKTPENSQNNKKRAGGFFENRMRTGYLNEYDDMSLKRKETQQATEKENDTIEENQNKITPNINKSFSSASVLHNQDDIVLNSDDETNKQQGKKLFEKPENWVALDNAPTINYASNQNDIETIDNKKDKLNQEDKKQFETEDNQINQSYQANQSDQSDKLNQPIGQNTPLFDIDNVPIDSTAERRKKRLEEFFSIKDGENSKEQKIAQQTAKAAEAAIDIADEASVEDNIFTLSSRVKHSGIHLALTTIVMIFSVITNLLPSFGIYINNAFNPVLNPDTFALINLATIIIALIICLKPVAKGIASAFSFTNDTDGLIGIFSIVCLIHTMIIVFNANDYLNMLKLPVLIPILTVGLFLNSLGNFINAKRMRKNYKVISSDYDKYCADIIDSDSLNTHLNRLSTYPQSIAVSSIKTNKLTGYFTFSESDEPSGVFSKIAAPVIICLALILGLFLYFNFQNVITAFTGAAIFVAVSCPLTSCLCGYTLLYKLSSKLFKKGAVVTGYEAAHNLSETNGVIIDAKDLFPSGTITLHGVKTFAGERIDEAIVNVASVVYAAKGAYSDMFLEVIEGKTEILNKVDSYIYEDGMGISAWIGSQRILVGNRRLLENHGVDAPSKDYEDRHIKTESKEIIYLAVAGSLAAMFIIKYNPDNEIKYYLEKIQRAGYDIFIKTNDSNLNEDKIASIYSIDKEILKVIPGSAYQDLDKATAPRETSFAKAVHTGSFPAFASTVFGSAKLNGAMKFSVVLQIIASIFCGVVAVLLTVTGALAQLTLPVLLIIGIFWSLVIITLPLLTDM